mgnify:CR=1 FL=1
MEYGNIITINHEELFFINYKDNEKIILISNKEPNKKNIYLLKDEFISENKFIIVYKPKRKGVCQLNQLYKDKLLYLKEFKDGITQEKTYKIIKQENDSITIHIENESETRTIHFDYKGIPEHILSIKSHDNIQLLGNNYNTNDETIDENENKNINNDEEPEVYIYSIQQEVNEMCEDLTQGLENESKKDIKYIDHIIKRYIELKKKYYNYETNYNLLLLSDTPIMDSIINHSIFEIISEKMKVIFYEIGELLPNIKNDELKQLSKMNSERFYLANDDEEELELIDNSKENLKINHIDEINRENINSLKLYNSDKDILYNKPELYADHCNVLLYDSEHMNQLKEKEHTYSIKTNEYFSLDGIVIPNYSQFREIINNSKMSSIIQKIHCMDYRKNIYDKKGLQFGNKNIIQVKKESDNFYEFLKSILPTMKNVIELITSRNKYYNIYNVLRELSIFNIFELRKEYYKMIKDNIKSYINELIQTYKKTIRLKERQIYKTNIDEENVKYGLFQEYLSQEYYSNSELYGYLNEYSHYLLLFDVKRENLKNRINIYDDDDSIKDSVYEIIKSMKKDKPKNHVHKVFNTIEELVQSLEFPILIDLSESYDNIKFPYKPQEFRNSIDLLWRKQAKWEYDYASKAIFEKEILNILKTKDFSEEPYFSHQGEIIDFQIEYGIKDGYVAYVISEDKNYIWKENHWDVYINESDIHKVIREKAQFIADNDNAYNNSLKSKYDENKRLILREKCLSIKHCRNHKILKYNRIKQNYNDYSEKLYGNIIESPYKELFDKIMNISNLSEKMKKIKLFCSKYCIEGSDIHWLYCIKTNTKLVPKFLNKLAYGYEQNKYEETMDKLCIEQGKEEGQFYIDIYSGYVIKQINYFEEEGFTSEGFKIKTREEISNKKEQELSDDMNHLRKNIFTIISTIGVEFDDIESIKKDIDIVCDINEIQHPYEVMCIMYSMIFLYIKLYINIDTIKRAFGNCKTSFDGYPMEDKENTSGIEYMLCIFNYLMLYNDTMKKFKKKFDYNVSRFKNNIDMIIDTIPKIKKDVENYRETRVKKEVKSDKDQLFLPRLKTIIYDKQDNYSYYQKCFIIQSLIHRFTNDQTMLLENLSGPLEINCFFYDDNKDPNAHFIPDRTYPSYKLCKEIRKLNKELNRNYRICNLSYYRKNTKIDYYSYNYIRPNEIYYLYFKYYEKYIQKETKLNLPKNFTLEDVEKVDDLLGIYHNVYNRKINIIENNVEKKKETKIDIKEIETDLDKDLKENETLLSSFNQLLDFSNDKKVNTFNEEEKEHLCYKNSILFNILQDVLFYLPNKTKNNVNYNRKSNELVCSSWNLNKVHLEDIMTIIEKFSFNNTTYEETMDIALNKYREYFYNVRFIQDNNKKYNFYYKLLFVIYVKIYKYDFRNYLDEYLKMYFLHINVDHDGIEKKNEKDKRLEKKQITDMFKHMEDEKKQIEMELKSNKLGVWAVGLDKSIYAYSKNKYVSDIQDVIDILSYEQRNELPITTEAEITETDFVEMEENEFIEYRNHEEEE